MPQTPEPEHILYTAGHSTRPFEEFLALLRAHHIQRVVDVRTIPKSRRYPWFNEETLAPALNKADIRYAHLPELGGLRKPNADSTNVGWKNSSFRGFADYMATPEFERGLAKLNEMVPTLRTAIMCAEAVPWRCHRSLISDAEVSRGIRVEHLMGAASVRPHALTPFAVVDPRSKPPRIRYPAIKKESGQTEIPGMPGPE